MERRLLTFIIASTAFFFVYISLRIMFVQPKLDAEKVAKATAAQVEATEDTEGASNDADGVKPVASEDQPGSDTEAPGEDEEQDIPARSQKAKWLTLGSMDPSENYFMLVTFCSRGAGVERVELTQRNDDGKFIYRRVDTQSGYLGYFAAEPAIDAEVDGVLVNVVGPGTPAALATCPDASGGIQVGDVIIAVAGKAVASASDLRKALMATKPKQQIKIEVVRASPNQGDEASRPVELEFTAELSEHPLDLVRLAKTGGDNQVIGNLNRLSSLMTLGKVNRKGIAAGQASISGLVDPVGLVWDAETTKSEGVATANFTVEMSASEMKAVGGDALAIKRSYTLQPGGFIIDTAIEIDNLGETEQELAYRLEGFNGITLEGWWYSNKISPNWGGSAARDIICKTAAEGHELISGYALLKQARDTPEDAQQTIFAPDESAESRDLKYIGIDAQYFDVAYLPPADQSSLQTFRRATANIVADPAAIEKHKEKAVNVSFYLDSVVQTVPAGSAMRQELRIYAGPKKPEILEGYGLGDAVYYGWFAFFAKPLVSLLHFLYWLVGNYAVAIILLTVLVRGLMFPLSRKAAINAQRMQELAPELKKIGEKYKDDMEGRLKAQRELQHRVGFNPMAGCLPMFLQLPIFIGLYRALSVDIELRQAAFSSSMTWASNLSAPDQFMYWGDWMWGYMSGRGTGWLGPYLNILPLLVMVLFLLQQKMFMPPATDEQTAMTQKMMSWMTLVMGLFFFRVPAGLCLYFVTSSLWGICERILVKKTLPAGKHFDQAVLEGGGASAPEKSKSLADRLREKVQQPEPQAPPPNKRKRPGGKKKK